MKSAKGDSSPARFGVELGPAKQKESQRHLSLSHSFVIVLSLEVFINMIDDVYRQRKIDHVTGHTGGSIWEINQVTFVAPACLVPPYCQKHAVLINL